MQLRCMGRCEALVGFTGTTLVGSTGEAPKIIKCLRFLQPWVLVAGVGNDLANAVLCGILDGRKFAVVRFSRSEKID